VEARHDGCLRERARWETVRNLRADERGGAAHRSRRYRTFAPDTSAKNQPDEEITVRVFSLLFLILLVAVLVVLAIENNRTTTIDVWKWSWELPFPAVAVGLYALGMLTGWALIGAVKRSWRRVTEYERA
jgi:uncharacterized integral membrane protein